MAIDTSALFTLKQQKFGAAGASTTFSPAFFYAMNRVCLDLNSPKVGLSITDIPTVVGEDIDIDDQYYGVVSDGLDLYIQDQGLWGKDDDRDLISIYERRLGEAHTMYLDDNPPTTRMSE